MFGVLHKISSRILFILMLISEQKMLTHSDTLKRAFYNVKEKSKIYVFNEFSQKSNPKIFPGQQSISINQGRNAFLIYLGFNHGKR